MTKPIQPFSNQTDIEVDAKAARCEAVRAVRVILGRQKPAENDASNTRSLPRSGSEPSRRGETTCL